MTSLRKDSDPADLSGASEVLVRARGLVVGYAALTVLHGIDFEIAQGEAVGIIGHNGAGKSTLLRAIAGTIGLREGSIELASPSRDGMRDRQRARITMVPQGMPVFPRMTVRENFAVPSSSGSRAESMGDLDRILGLFPSLRERLDLLAGNLSGGEQQMLGIGMALRTAPDVLLLDEPSVGLAPVLVDQIMEVVDAVRQEFGCAMVIVEQNVDALSKHVGRLVALRRGEVAWSGPVSELSSVDLWNYF